MVFPTYCNPPVDNQFGRVREVNRIVCSMRKEGAEHSNRNCFVVDYHPALRALYNIFRELQIIVSWSERFLRILPEPPMVCLFKCGKKKCKIAIMLLRGMNLEVMLKDGLFALIIVSMVTQRV